MDPNFDITILLQNFVVSLLGDFASEVPKSELEAIVRRLGGQIVRSCTDLSAIRRTKTRLVIVDSTKPNPEIRNIFPALQIAVVMKDWILDSVGAFRDQYLKSFLL